MKQLSRQRILWIGVPVIIILIGLGGALPYRYLILSKLNIAAPTDSARALGLRQVAEITLPGSASRLDYASIDPDRALLFIAHLGAGDVIAFDLKRQQVAADIPDIASVHGVIAVPQLHRVYASATGTNQVAVIDEDGLRVIARTEGGDYPDGLAYDPDTNKVFVSDENGGTDTVIDANTNQRVDTIQLGGEVGNTQYDAGSHWILAAAQSKDQLAVIDPQTDAVVRRVDLPGCNEPHGFYVDSTARLAFIACAGNATLAILDLQTMQVRGTQSIGQAPDVLAFDNGLRRLYVASESGVVSVFEERGQALDKIGQAFLAPNAHTIAVDSTTHRVYVPLENIDGHPVLRIFEP